MWIGVEQVLVRSWSRAMAWCSTSTLGFIAFGIGTGVVSYLVTVGIQWWSNGPNWITLKNAFRSNLAYLMAAIIPIIIIAPIFAMSLVLTIYDTQLAERPAASVAVAPERRQSQNQEGEENPPTSKSSPKKVEKADQGHGSKPQSPAGPAPGPHGSVLNTATTFQQPYQPQSVQSSPVQPFPRPEEQVYPTLEAAAGQVHSLSTRWAEDLSQVRSMAISAPVGKPSGMKPNSPDESRLQDEQWRQYRTKVDQEDRAALDRAEQQLSIKDRNAGIDYSNLRPTIISSRDSAFGCMNLTQQERSSEQESFRNADTTAAKSLLLKELGPGIQDGGLRLRFSPMELYLNSLLARLAKFHCGVSRRGN